MRSVRARKTHLLTSGCTGVRIRDGLKGQMFNCGGLLFVYFPNIEKKKKVPGNRCNFKPKNKEKWRRQLRMK